MKKTSLLFFYMLVLVNHSLAQGINFVEDKAWQEVLALAKKENKLIFLDAYATWCGPCKYLQAKVFTDNAVGNQYNKSFINVKMDMEKGEGVKLAEQLKLNAYPTLFFFNKDGEVVHKYVGAMEVPDFINLGKDATDPEKQFYSVLSKAKTGKIAPKAFDDWIHLAEKIDKENVDEVIRLYLSKATYPFMEKGMLTIILDHVSLLSEKQLNDINANKVPIMKLTEKTQEEFNTIFLSKVTNFAFEKARKMDTIDFISYKTNIARYLPDKAESETKKLKIRYQLIKGTIGFTDLIMLEDKELLEVAANHYYEKGEGNKEYLNKAKQLYTKLCNISRQEEAVKYIRAIIPLNTELNELEKTNYFGKVERLKENIKLEEKLLPIDLSDTIGSKIRLSNDYGSLAFYQLFIKDFQGAVHSAQKGLEIHPVNDWIYTNLALGYLLSKQFDKAEAIYSQYKDKSYSNGEKTFKEAFLQDIQDLEMEGIISPGEPEIYKGVTKVKGILKN